MGIAFVPPERSICETENNICEHCKKVGVALYCCLWSNGVASTYFKCCPYDMRVLVPKEMKEEV